MTEPRDTDKKFNPAILLYVGIIVVAVIGSAIFLYVALKNEATLTEQDKSRAMSNCVTWLNSHTVAPNPVKRCTDARKDDPTQFYMRWSPAGQTD